MASMNTLAVVTVLTALTALSAGTGTAEPDKPAKPWLTLNRAAKVLHLRCEPSPRDPIYQVHHLKLLASLQQHSVSSNISVATIASKASMKEPQVNDDVFSISRSTFKGSWDSPSTLSLDVVFPVTSKELGRYFCEVKYSDDKHEHKTSTTGVVVDNFNPGSTSTDKGFTVKVIQAHEIKVTGPYDIDQFTEASVSRVLVDKEGNDLSPPFSLFTIIGTRHVEYESKVLLTKFSNQDHGNFSINLYVEREERHSELFRYTCFVPHHACTAQNAVLCSCCQQETNPDRQKCPTSQTYQTPFIVCLVFLLIMSVLVVFISIVYCLYRNRKCQNRWLFKRLCPLQEEDGTPENEQLLEEPAPVPMPAPGQSVPMPAPGQSVPMPAPGQLVPTTASDQSEPMPAPDQSVPTTASDQSEPTRSRSPTATGQLPNGTTSTAPPSCGINEFSGGETRDERDVDSVADVRPETAAVSEDSQSRPIYSDHSINQPNDAHQTSTV
ncbi:uncharacterized protein LOC143301273 [Babylonia areolata]|uniref:uncharacterized protein LOC143301273 n=1 Tax=Babylonia areolata TaxID=304850 RepID=UPI003FD44B7F